MGGKDPVVRVVTPKEGLMGVVTTPPWVVTTSLVVTTPVRRGCKLSVRDSGYIMYYVCITVLIMYFTVLDYFNTNPPPPASRSPLTDIRTNGQSA